MLIPSKIEIDHNSVLIETGAVSINATKSYELVDTLTRSFPGETELHEAVRSTGIIEVNGEDISLEANNAINIAAPSVSIVAAAGVDTTTTFGGDITIRAVGGGAKTAAVVGLASNVFAVEKVADLTAEEAAAAPDNRRFAVHGSGVTQMSIDTIVLDAEAVAVAPGLVTISPTGAELRRFTIINATGAIDGNTYTLALADGIYGQVKTFSIGEKSDVGSAYVTITPTSSSFTHVVLSTISSGHSVTLAYTDKWHIVSGIHSVDYV